MLDIRQNERTNACVACPFVVGKTQLADSSRLSEAVGLAAAINLHVVLTETPHMREVKPATFFSRGFIEKIKPLIKENDISLLVADTSLTPVQQRNLEQELKIKVIDRTALILEIFGERARTREGKLQVELAHLTYQRSRLVRSWTHLERQRGGAGFLGGPGEKQIELDRRIIDDKIVKIKKELEKVKNTRSLQRKNRKKVPYPVVALVGYTNAGKSTLFNYFTGSGVLAENMLFATLDPTLRKISLPSGKEAVLSDTVGFISDLPHELIMAFRSTLEEVLEADVVLHIRDISSPETDEQRKDVLRVLKSLGLDFADSEQNYIEVLNKTDLLTDEDRELLKKKLVNGKKNIISVSALNGEGCGDLLRLVDKMLAEGEYICRIPVENGNGPAQSWLYGNAEVLHKSVNDNITEFTVRIKPAQLHRFEKLFNIVPV